MFRLEPNAVSLPPECVAGKVFFTAYLNEEDRSPYLSDQALMNSGLNLEDVEFLEPFVAAAKEAYGKLIDLHVSKSICFYGQCSVGLT